MLVLLAIDYFGCSLQQQVNYIQNCCLSTKSFTFVRVYRWWPMVWLLYIDITPMYYTACSKKTCHLSECVCDLMGCTTVAGMRNICPLWKRCDRTKWFACAHAAAAAALCCSTEGQKRRPSIFVVAPVALMKCVHNWACVWKCNQCY